MRSRRTHRTDGRCRFNPAIASPRTRHSDRREESPGGAAPHDMTNRVWNGRFARGFLAAARNDGVGGWMAGLILHVPSTPGYYVSTPSRAENRASLGVDHSYQAYKNC